MSYSSLDDQKAIEYAVNAGLFPQDGALEVNEIGDGNINVVYRIFQPKTGESIILKQAIPYVRCVGESWPLTLDRMKIEAELGGNFRVVHPVEILALRIDYE